MTKSITDVPRLVIAGTHSGTGKTTVTLGLMAALKASGLCVQGYKAGPDYIDPSYHAAVTGRPPRNLDTWMFAAEPLLASFAHGVEGADIALIEGVMGFFDGRKVSDDVGSTAALAKRLKAPVLLVIDAGGMARSAAAVVHGFQTFDPDVRLAGVIANRVGSQGHATILQEAIEEACGIPLLGWLSKDDELGLPERHLGLIPQLEMGNLETLFERLGRQVGSSVDLDRIIDLARQAEPLATKAVRFFQSPSARPTIRLGVAKDAAFNFYYQDNLDLLETGGFELVEFSPLTDGYLPAGLDGLYIGGGFPEMFAARLAANTALAADIRCAGHAGMPIYAECGGLMYLGQSLEDADGKIYEMVGLLPVHIRMETRLQALGYREVKARCDIPLLRAGQVARGHEFHYSSLQSDREPHVFTARGIRRETVTGWQFGQTVGSYMHLHFLTQPEIARNWGEACLAYRKRRGMG